MPKRTPKSFFAMGWRRVREAGVQRLVLTALLLIAALLIARLSWILPFTDDAERSLFDFRSYVLAEKIETDERVQMLVYDDQTLLALRKRSPLDRALLARALRNIDGLGIKAIGIDILFDQPQDEDDELIETLRSMQTPVSVAYANVATNELDIVYAQQDFLESFMAQLEGSNAVPASIKLSTENGGVMRVWPEIEEGLPPLLGRSMLRQAGESLVDEFEGYEGAIRYRNPALEDVPIFSSSQIDLVANDELMAIPAVRDEVEEALRGSYVLIGGDILDYDRVLTPFSTFDDEATEGGARNVRPPGIELHAEIIAQMLDGQRLAKPSSAFLWFYAAMVVVAAALTALLEIKSWKFTPLLIAQMALFIGLPFFLHTRGVDTYEFLAVGPALGWVLAFLAVVSVARASGAVQRRFAQGALGKYLPQSIADEIIENPELLELGGAKREIYVIFSDLEGFTKMSHAIEPEMVAKLLNRYLDMLSEVVLDHGGILDKFVGDAVVAFWGAPISRPDDGERAAKAGMALWQAGEDFRAEVAAMDEDLPPIGKTRVGMHFGEAVVGNFGGENRIQYTALGDSMNTAARLEAANKALESSVMASREFVERSGLDWWRPMGRIVLRGRSKPVDVFEPSPQFDSSDRVKLENAIELMESDHEQAVKLIEQVASSNPADIALQNLLRRSSELNEEGSYVLG